MDCGLESGLKAVASQSPAVLSLHNPSAQPRRLYWIDFQGHRKSYGIIAPGADCKQSSSVGNHWVVTDEADQCVALFAASAAATAFVIAALPAPAPASVAPAPTGAAVAARPGITLEGFNPPVGAATSDGPSPPEACPSITPEPAQRIRRSTMHRLLRYVVLAIFTASLAAPHVQAETPDRFCRSYASRAVQQGRVARQVSSCRHLIAESPQRWALNRLQHFAYCMRIYGSGAGMAEDAIRTRQVRFCAGP